MITTSDDEPCEKIQDYGTFQLTALVTGIMAKLWCQRPDPMFLLILTTLGPLVSFEGLLSYYGDEIDMWGDMAVAVEDTHTVTFTLSRCGIQPR